MLTTLFLIVCIYFMLRAFTDTPTTGTQGERTHTYTYGQNRRMNFITALLVLIAEVMKADGQVKRVELDYVKAELVKLLGYEDARLAVLQLRDILKQPQNIYTVMEVVHRNVDYDSRLAILHILYGIAKADGVVTDEERRLIRRIGLGIGLSERDTESIMSTFTAHNNIDDAYKVLEIEPTATDEEVKKAYRTMAMKYHPDRVATLGDEIAKNAEVKFKQVQDAYEKIKAQRNLK